MIKQWATTQPLSPASEVPKELRTLPFAPLWERPVTQEVGKTLTRILLSFVACKWSCEETWEMAVERYQITCEGAHLHFTLQFKLHGSFGSWHVKPIWNIGLSWHSWATLVTGLERVSSMEKHLVLCSHQAALEAIRPDGWTQGHCATGTFAVEKDGWVEHVIEIWRNKLMVLFLLNVLHIHQKTFTIRIYFLITEVVKCAWDFLRSEAFSGDAVLS